jgi:hypothetical protein
VPRVAAGLVVAMTAGCGGGAPLLHPAHVLRPGVVSAGAGVSGEIAVRPLPQPIAASSPVAPNGSASGNEAGLANELGVAPGVAPWVGARFGIVGDNEAGLTYAGRALRLDGRHAFELGGTTLSLGLGASAIAARRPDAAGSGVFGGGVDVPLLVGWRSRSDVYAGWLGPRGGVELLRGRILDSELGPVAGPATSLDASITHGFVGGVVGARVGFRHLHVAVELDGAWHHVSGSLGPRSASLDQVTITPAGALVATF